MIKAFLRNLFFLQNRICTLEFRDKHPRANRSIDRRTRDPKERSSRTERREGSRYRSGYSSAPRVNGFKRRSQRLRARTRTYTRTLPVSQLGRYILPPPPKGTVFLRGTGAPLLMTAETASKISRSVRERDPSACVRDTHFFQMRRHRRHRRRQVINGGY